MKRKPVRLISSAFFWSVTTFLGVCFAVSLAIFTSPISEDALKHLLKEETFKGITLKDLTVKKKIFNFARMRWTFELNARIEKIWGVPMPISDLSLEGSKELFGNTDVRRAVMRFGADAKIFKGGLVLSKDDKGNAVWDLSNLDFAMGTLEKKSGVATYLNVESISENGFKAHVFFDNVRIPLEVSYTQDSMVFQIPKTTLKTSKQKLPFKGLSQIPTTGEWTFASRVQMSDGIFSEASMLEVSNALLSLANVDTSLIRNGRGVGVLNLKMSSSEGLMNGKLDIDLEKSTFELNDGRFFKVDGAPFRISADLNQNTGELEIISEGSSRLAAQISKESVIDIKFKEFDLSIIPNLQKFFGGPIRGFITGSAVAELQKDNLGNLSIEMNSIRADSADAVFEAFKFPGTTIVGNADFSGSFSANPERKRIDGKLDFTKAKLRLADLYSKEADTELLVRIKAENVDNEWKTFDLKTSVNEQAVEIKGRDSFVSFIFPNTFKAPGGALISGSVTYPFCDEKYCTMSEPVAYNLKLSDYESEISYLKDLKLSGNVSKNEETYEVDSFVLRWPSGDRLSVSGTIQKYKVADLKAVGVFNYNSIALSNPFLFFKELPLQKAKLDLKMDLLNQTDEWKFAGVAQLANKKLNFEELTLSQNLSVKYAGRAELDFEPYLLRNEAVTLTSTLDSTGNFSAFKDFPLKGSYDAHLVLASSGLNSNELSSRMKIRASGDAEIEQSPVTLLLKQGLEAYSKEKQKASANALAKCYPKKMRGKFDFDYSQGRWNLSPSAFLGVDRDSMIKVQGVLGDLSNINLISHYLPGPSCNAELAACLGDAFPKGGMSFEITGAFKDPETDLDFAFIDQSLERCREIEAKREVAAEETPLDTRDQKVRIEELKSFYNSRNLSR